MGNTFHEQFYVILNRAHSIVSVHLVMVKSFDRIISSSVHLVQVIIGRKVWMIDDNYILINDLSPRGYYGEGAEMIDYMLDAVRREVENTDCMQGNDG